MQGNSIWIVHETLHMLLLLRNAIAMRGYRNVRCFAHGEEVVVLVRQGLRPDVIIAEDGLTGMSGNNLLTLVDSMCEMCSGILLVSPDANPYIFRHHTVIEGAAGFHESLVQALQLATHDEVNASAALSISSISGYADEL